MYLRAQGALLGELMTDTFLCKVTHSWDTIPGLFREEQGSKGCKVSEWLVQKCIIIPYSNNLLAKEIMRPSLI